MMTLIERSGLRNALRTPLVSTFMTSPCIMG
jgi:hypothetical protein